MVLKFWKDSRKATPIPIKYQVSPAETAINNSDNMSQWTSMLPRCAELWSVTIAARKDIFQGTVGHLVTNKEELEPLVTVGEGSFSRDLTSQDVFEPHKKEKTI